MVLIVKQPGEVFQPLILLLLVNRLEAAEVGLPRVASAELVGLSPCRSNVGHLRLNHIVHVRHLGHLSRFSRVLKQVEIGGGCQLRVAPYLASGGE